MKLTVRKNRARLSLHLPISFACLVLRRIVREKPWAHLLHGKEWKKVKRTLRQARKNIGHFELLHISSEDSEIIMVV